MKRIFNKRLLSFLLVLLMVLEMAPLSAVHVHATDNTDLSIDFDYQSEFGSANEALLHEAQDGHSYTKITEDQVFQDGYSWVKIFDGDLKREGGKLRKALESSDPDEKYIVLSQNVELRYGSGEWKPIKITSDKVLDLNGFTLTWWDKTNKVDSSWHDWQSTNIYDHYLDKYFIYIQEGATLTIIDSSAPVNGYDTGKGTGKMVAGAQIIDAYEQQLDYYTHRDLFVVNGNLVIYGGTLQAGRQKDQYKSNFTWDKLADCLGKTLDLGLSIAEYATGLDAASAAMKDVETTIANRKPAQGNTSDTGENSTSDSATNKPTGEGGRTNQTVDTPTSAGSTDNSNDRAQTVGERTGTDNSSNNTSNNQTGGSAAQTGGQNQANGKGTAKEDKNSLIAAEEKKVVQAALDKDKIIDMWNKGINVVSSIGSMLGNAEGTRTTQTIWGTVAKVNASGTLVVYGGTLQGHGSSPNLRNATIEIVRQGLHSGSEDKQKNDGGRAYIFGGIVEGYAGANCFNFVRAPKAAQTGAARAFVYTADGHDVTDITYLTATNTVTWKNGDGDIIATTKIEYPYTYELDVSETNNMEILHYENQDAVAADTTGQVDPIPIDTSNVVVRGGTFRTYCELTNQGVRLPYLKEVDPDGGNLTFVKFTGTSGSVNLGLESFGEDMIRDGRIQLVDVYGDGTLVLMDETVDEAHPAGLKHYRLYCGDTELRHIRYLDVYPMNAGANATHSFSLQTYYGQSNLSNISTWNAENDEENLHTAPFAGDEYFFDYEFDARDARDYYVMPNLDGGIYDTSMQDSEAWYYPEPVDSKGNPIPDFASTIVLANFTYKGTKYTAPVQYMKDLYIFQDGDYDDLSTATYYRSTNEGYRENLKWFRYRVYRVDPITRENISESDTWGVDEPLVEVVYGVAEDEAMRCKLDLYDLSQYLIEKTKHSDDPWTGYKQGEMYRIVFNVDEYVNYGYTGDASIGTDKSMKFWYFGDYHGLNDWMLTNIQERRRNAFAGYMPVASTESSVLFRCSSVAEQAELPNTNASSNIFYDTDYTPLQFGSYAVMAGKDATINFVNAKVSQADNAGNDFISVYYQWYVSDDAIVDRDSNNPTKVTDTLLAGMTNINMDWNTSSDHRPEKWNPDADEWDYRNTLSPDDPHYEEYGEDGLPDNPEYWTMYDLHAYTTELRQNELCMKPGYTGNLTMQNNDPFAYNTDSCYIPEEIAGKYVYVRAIVTNLKDEYTKIYDKKQVFYSHPMLVIDPSMLQPETQEPNTEVAQVVNAANGNSYYYHKSVDANLGQDMLFGFTGSALPEDMKKEGFEISISQKVVNSVTGEVVYEAASGNTINLKNIVTQQGHYRVDQTQQLSYKRPYWSWKENQFKEAIIKEEFVTSRVDRFLVTVSLPLPDDIDLDYPKTGFEVGEEITITATTEPEGDYWYRWLLDGPGALDELTVLQDSQSPVLKYTFTNETSQRFWVQVYAKDAQGNESVNNKAKVTDEIFPGDQMVVTTYVNGEEIVSANNYSATVRLEKGSDAVMSVEVAGGRGEYTYSDYKRPKGQYHDSLIGRSDTITIDTSAVGQAEYVIYVDDEYTEGASSVRLYVYVYEPLAITSAREATTTINKPTLVNLWAKYVGYEVSGQIQEKVNGRWQNMTNSEWETDGDCEVYVGTVGTHEYRVVLTDYFGNEVIQNFTVVYDTSEPYTVVARGKGNLLFRAKGDSEYGITFSEGEDVEMFYNGGINLDPGSEVYTDIRQEIKETYGQEIAPKYDTVEISFKLHRFNDPWKASLAGGGVDVYEEAGYDIWLDYIYDSYTYDTPSKMPEAPVSHIDGTYMTPGYYRAVWKVEIACEEPEGKYTFYMSGLFEVVPAGQGHVHNYAYESGKIDKFTHYQKCICGHRIEGEHDFRTDYVDQNALNIPWTINSGYVKDPETGKYVGRKSGIEYRVCYDPTGECKCYYSQYRWAFVEGLTLSNETLELGMKGSVKMDYSIDFMEEFDALYLENNPSTTDIYNVDEFMPPNNAVTWVSSDESVATVDADGNITAVGVGTAEITCTTVQPKYEGGQITETCTVTVSCPHAQIVPVAATESTCSVAGCIEHYECAECGTVSLDGTCTDGKTLEDVTLPLASHAASNVFGYNEEGHFRTCKYGCGYKFGAVTAHTYNVSAADCTTAKYCTRCKYEAEAKHDHDLIYMETMEATCTDTGLEAAYNCMTCGAFFLDAGGTLETTESKLNIRALGHSWVNATCDDPKTCSRCGETEGTELGHTWHSATCESPETCGRCGLTTGSSLGHTWVDATCTSAKTCSVCLKTEGDKLPHTYNPADGTCTTDAVCSICSTIVIPHTGHTLIQVEAKTPTCSEAGHEAYEYCSVCDYTTFKEVAALGHAWGDWIETKAPTVDQEGEEMRTCSSCGETETRSVETLIYVTLDVDDASHGKIEGSDELYVKKNTSFTITASALAGYVFAAWTVDGVQVSTSSTYTVASGVSSAVTYIATFKMLGDLDGNFGITVEEVAKLLNGLTNKAALSASESAVADFNGDGDNNLLDAYLMYVKTRA